MQIHDFVVRASCSLVMVREQDARTNYVKLGCSRYKGVFIMKDKYILYRTYEVIPQFVAGAKPNKPILFSWLGNIWGFLIDQLIGSNQPRIWQECDRSGEIFWRVYDPCSGRSAYCYSEDEVRAWLDQLPYFH